MHTTNLTIRYWDDPILSKVCTPISASEFGSNLNFFAHEMLNIMNKLDGYGLAAPQVGIPLQVFVMKKDDSHLLVCNPTLEFSGLTISETEGCLSIPTVYSQVDRALTCTMNYFTPHGEEKEIVLNGLEARVAAHESDHLNGIMFFNKLSRQMKREVERNWNKVKNKYIQSS